MSVRTLIVNDPFADWTFKSKLKPFFIRNDIYKFGGFHDTYYCALGTENNRPAVPSVKCNTCEWIKFKQKTAC